METPLSQQVKFLYVTNRERDKSLSGLWANDLPEDDYASTYGLEMANLLAFWIDLGPIVQGFSRFKKNEAWTSVEQPLCLGIAIAFLTAQMGKSSIFTENNATHVRTKLNSRLDGLGELVNLPSDPILEVAVAAARASGVIDSAVYSARLTFSSSNQLERMMKIPPVVAKSFATVKTFLEHKGVSGDHFAPIRGVSNSTELVSTKKPTPANFDEIDADSKSRYLSGTSYVLNSESQYEYWVQYCRDAAELQRIPQRFINDLIPPTEFANHSLKKLSEWEDALEERFPGRRQWLLDEGVTRKDFDTFWGSPSWVQDFIMEMMRRNQQLEFKSFMATGESEKQAAIHTAMFIPYFDIQPRDVGPETRPMPVELFERVRKYYASLDDSWQSEFVANKCITLNNYLRMCIREKRF